MKTTEFTTALIHCLDEWKCTIEYRANWNATGNSQEINEYVEGDVKIRLHKRGSIYFIEERIGKTMYPKIYKVNLTDRPLTEADFEVFLRSKGIIN